MHQKHANNKLDMSSAPQRGTSKMPAHWTFLLLCLFGVLLYAVVMPSMMVSQIEVTNSHHKVVVTLTSGHSRLKGSKTQLPGSSRSRSSRRQLALGDLPGAALTQQSNTEVDQGLTWQRFWGSELEHGVRSLQQLNQVLDKIRYQRLTKDVEDQATAGLDLLMADALADVANATRLQETQAWLRKEVTGAVFQTLYDLQHPANCSNVKKLYCQLGKTCGFGCQLHHVVHCFTIAVALNRTMVVKVYPTNYITTATGWTDSMQPISSCDESGFDPNGVQRFSPFDPSKSAHAEVLFVNVIDGGTSKYDPPAMPKDVHDVVQLFTSRPEIWWVGVLASYLVRPSAASIQRQAAFKAAHDWGGPIAGVHVRRTDKLAGEAKLHQVPEYMAQVEHFCDQRLPSGWQHRAMKLAEDQVLLEQQEQQMANAAAVAAGAKPADVAAGSTAAAGTTAGAAAGAGGKKQQRSECSVYLASDEPNVATEIRQKYKHIHVITNEQALQTSAVNVRYTNEGFLGVYDDIMYMSFCDVIVGTFSSQVSRMAYEISLVNNTLGAPDRTFAYHSVDSMWYYGGMVGFTKCASSDFTSEGTIVVKAGQKLTCATIHEFAALTGYARCKLFNTQIVVQGPPGLVVDCPAEESSYRAILPEHMQRPAAAKAAGDGAAGGEAPAVGHDQAAGGGAVAAGAAKMFTLRTAGAAPAAGKVAVA